ncbi:EAL domain-containing protein [Shewanella mangrovisoli]|uniref:EAL domain-containing protein n=1 Tax=Shewanella mangrovisoli TaxID=2864211 RepID=UPI0035B6FC32
MIKKDAHFDYVFVFSLYLIGVLLLFAYGFSRLNSEARERESWVSQQMTDVISEIQHFYEWKLAPSIPITDCDRFLQDSMPLLLSSPYIRSINVAHGGVIVCSSISKQTLKQIKNWNASGKQLELRYVTQTPFSELFPTHRQAILSLHFEKNRFYGMYIALYPESVFRTLGAPRFLQTVMRFENATFYSDGRIVDEQNSLPAEQLFSVDSDISTTAFAKYIFYNYGVLLIAWTFIMLMSAKSLVRYLHTFSLDYWRIRKAIKLNQFHPYIQPVVNDCGEVTGGEVLVRWIHPKKGVLSPADFIDLVEENGQIVEITSILMQKCQSAFSKVNLPEARQHFRVGFNVCPIQFDSNTLCQDIEHFQSAMADKPISLLIEMTERKEFSSNDKYRKAIHELRSRDVLVALDDFGTGHCSLKYLHDTEIDMIKIDMMYVATIESGNTKILDNIISLARSLDVILLAEGVETQAQFDYLKARNIERYQGYMFGKPLPIDEFIQKYLM